MLSQAPRVVSSLDLETVATAFGLSLSLTVDPTADAPERWLCWLGLDHCAAGATPDDAISMAINSAFTTCAHCGATGQKNVDLVEQLHLFGDNVWLCRKCSDSTKAVRS